MKRSEIKAKFDQIVDFSGVEKFLDTPVKHYSSGMKVRLAFSVAAHLEPEILIVDEVLAVGDAEFQKKCLGKMDEVSKREGRTVLFVSHNMAAIQALCNSGIILNEGQIALHKGINIAIDQYLKSFGQNFRLLQSCGDYVDSVLIRQKENSESTVFKYGDDIIFEFRLSEKFNFQLHHIGFFIIDASGIKIGAASTAMIKALNYGIEAKTQNISFVLKAPPLIEGKYSVDISITNKIGGRLEYLSSAAEFEIIATDIFGTGTLINSHLGKIYFNVEADF
jgi:lipopolysaccharide transport system ATP-binding protein